MTTETMCTGRPRQLRRFACHAAIRCCAVLAFSQVVGCYSVPTYHRKTISGSQSKYYILNDSIEPGRRYPVIFLVAGSGMHSAVAADKGVFGARLAGKLWWKQAGYVDSRYLVVAPEKLNVPEGFFYHGLVPKGFHRTNTLESRAANVEAVVRDVLASYNIDRTKIVLVGASEGGFVVPIVARRISEITHVIIEGSGGWSHQQEYAYKIRNKRLTRYDQQRRELQSEAAFSRFCADLRRNPDDLERTWGGWPYRRWASFMFYAPLDDLLALDASILILHGDRDESSLVEGALALKKEFDRAGKKNLTVRIYPGLDHQFTDAAGASHFRRVLVDLYGWLERN